MPEAPGTWVMGCICPSETHVRNLRIFEWHAPEDNEAVAACQQQVVHGTMDGMYEDHIGGDYHPKLRASVTDELEWCSCGNPERVDELMLEYLTNTNPDYPNILGVETDAQILCAYIADKLGWTEHGGSVFGAWLTDDGIEALTNLQSPEYG